MSFTVIRPRNRLTVALGLSAALLATAAPDVQGQSTSGAADAFCWRGKPLPSCGAFALFELEVAFAVASTTVVYEGEGPAIERPVFTNELKWHLGAMRNLSEEWALGAAVTLGPGSRSPLTGMQVRARRWLHSPVSAEFEAGIVDTGFNDRFGSGFGWGPSVGARLSVADRFSVFTRWEGAYARAASDTRSAREAGFHQGLYAGASAGSTVAVAGTAALGAVVLLFVLALNRADF